MWRSLAKRLAGVVHWLTPDDHLDEERASIPIEAVQIAARDSLAAYGDTVPEGAFAYDLPAVAGRLVVRSVRRAGGGRRVHVALRGTANPKNVLVDLSAGRVFDASTGHRFHEGFLAYANAAWDVVRPFLERDDVVSFTGHSLGGAVAQILTLKMTAVIPATPQAPCVTFGAPMMGDRYAAEAVRRSAAVLRVVNDNDLIPLVPISPRYWHVGSVLVVDDTRPGWSQLLDERSAFRAGRSSWCGAVSAGHRKIGTEYNDHRMTQYIAAVDALAGNPT